MGRSEDFKKLPRFDDAPESQQRPEIPPPPRMPSISPPAVGRHVPPPLRGARPDTAPPPAIAAHRQPSAPPPVLSRSAPPPPQARLHSAAPEEEPIERIDMKAILRTPPPPPVVEEEPLEARDIMDFGEGWQDPDAPTKTHKAARRPGAEDKPSIAPVSMSSEELIEVTHIARNNRLARVGYAAVFGATIVAGLYVWRMQPTAAAQASVAAAVPRPIFKEPAQLIAATAQPVIESAAEPTGAAATADKVSAPVAAANQPASVSKRRSSKESKSENAGTASTAEETPASAPASDSTSSAPAETAAEPAVAETAPPAEPELPPFNQAAAQAALDAAAGRAAGCLKEGEPAGMARVVVTFATTGRVTTAAVDGAPYAGTATGGCIARAFRSAEIAPFSGKLMTVGKTVTLR